MKKLLRYLLFSIGGIVFVILLAWAIRIFQMSRVPSGANEPGIPGGGIILFSKYIKPKRFDFICFAGIPWAGQKEGVMVFRLCGFPGDVIEMRANQLFIGGRLVDDQLSLKHLYSIPVARFLSLKDSFRIEDDDISYGADSVLVSLRDEDIKKHEIESRAFRIETPMEEGVFEGENSSWTIDDFGPVTVPKDAYFVLGDNRHSASDSRFRGFIKKESFRGTVFRIF